MAAAACLCCSTRPPREVARQSGVAFSSVSGVPPEPCINSNGASSCVQFSVNIGLGFRRLRKPQAWRSAWYPSRQIGTSWSCRRSIHAVLNPSAFAGLISWYWLCTKHSHVADFLQSWAVSCSRRGFVLHLRRTCAQTSMPFHLRNMQDVPLPHAVVLLQDVQRSLEDSVVWLGRTDVLTSGDTAPSSCDAISARQLFGCDAKTGLQCNLPMINAQERPCLIGHMHTCSAPLLSESNQMAPGAWRPSSAPKLCLQHEWCCSGEQHEA